MSDPFAIATDSLFSTQVAVSGVLTDTNSNQYNVRCVVQSNLTLALQSYATQVRDDRTTITVSKRSIGVALNRDVYSSLEVNGKTYSFDSVAQEDDYTISWYCLEV